MPPTGPRVKCRECKRELAVGTDYCPKCKCWTSAKSLMSGEKKLVIRLDESAAKPVERVDLGIPLLNTFFGGGLVRTSTTLLGGNSGAGKTTWMLMVADIFVGIYGRDVVYLANEQAHDEICTTAQRLELAHMHEICIVDAMGGMGDVPIWDIIRKHDPCLVIIDSLSKACGNDAAYSVTIAADFKGVAVERRVPIFLLNHVNKDEDHSGLKKLQHEVDCVCLMETEDTAPKDAPRRLGSSKNRNGVSPQHLAYFMTAKGLRFAGPWTDKHNVWLKMGREPTDKEMRELGYKKW